MSPTGTGVAAGDPGPERAGARRRAVPQLAGSSCDHRRGVGRLDESARRLSHEELAVARQLADEGHAVSSRAERPGLGPTSDLVVCGESVEVKAFLALADRGGGRPSARSVANKLLDASRQAPSAVLYGAGSGLDELTARRGVQLFAARGGFERLSVVRVLGDRFDLSWGSAGRIVGRNPRRADLGAPDPPAPRGLER